MLNSKVSSSYWSDHFLLAGMDPSYEYCANKQEGLKPPQEQRTTQLLVRLFKGKRVFALAKQQLSSF